jgi:hypothetical protein
MIMHSLPSGLLLRTSPVRAALTSALAIFLIIGSLTTVWSLATPLMTVPDEPAHAIKAAAVARGQFQAQSSGKQGDPLVVWVPAYFAILGEQTCTAFKADLTADCAPEIDGNNREATLAPTTAGNYNPFYYLLAGLPSRVLAGAPALYAMRIVTGLITAFFLTTAFLAAARMRNRQWPLIASTVALTPMALYLAGSINPNSLEIAATAAFFLNLCVVLENSRSLASVRVFLLAAGLAGFALANTRALSLIWLAAAFIVALIIYGWKPLLAVVRDKLGLSMTVLAVLGCVTGLLWLVVADSFKSLGGIPSSITPDQAFVTMLDRTFDYVSGYIGLMGWLDTHSPGGVQIFFHFAFVALLLASLTAKPVRNRWAPAPVALAAVLLPPFLQSQVIHDLGYIWQGRYLLAMVVLLLLACGVALASQPFTRSPAARTLSPWLLGLAAAAHLYAFLFLLRRYTVGILPLHTNWSEMAEPLWQPPLTWQVLAIAYGLVLTLGAVLIHRALFASNRRPRRQAIVGRHSSQGFHADPTDINLTSNSPQQVPAASESGSR